MVNPYAAPASGIETAVGDEEARAARMAGAVVVSVAFVRFICSAFIVYAGATESDILGALPRGIRGTVMWEMMAFPFLAPLVAVVYGIAAVPHLQGRRRRRGLTLGLQILYAVSPLMMLLRAVGRADLASSFHVTAASCVLALLSIGIVALLLFGRTTRGRVRLASAGIACFALVWTARLIGLP